MINDENVVTQSIIVYLNRHEMKNNKIKERISTCTSEVEKIIGNYSHSTSKLIEYKNEYPYKYILENNEFTNDSLDYIEINQLPSHKYFLLLTDNNHSSKETSDRIIGMKLQLPHKGEILEGCALNCKCTSDGLLVGTENRILYLIQESTL